MYEGIDEDLAGSYDAKKIAANQRTPKLPDVEVNYEAELLRVVKDKSPKAGKFYAFKFRVTKSNNELVPESAVYSTRFYPGASDVDFAMFWERITPLLMAVFGEGNVLKFNAAEKLGELLSICGASDEDLNLAFGCTRTLEPCRPDKKTGEVKHKNEDGTPKKFPRDNYRHAKGAPAQAA